MTPTDVTLLLQRMSDGDHAAGDELAQVVYAELHALASSQMRRQGKEHTLQPTALVNEAWLRLIQVDDPKWSGRRHFFLVVAKAMRSVLIDHVRRQRRQKRDSGALAVLPSQHAVALPDSGPLDIIALDDALLKLTAIDETMAQLVELRFFGGRTMEESAECLQVSLSTAERIWRLSKAWLFRELGGDSLATS